MNIFRNSRRYTIVSRSPTRISKRFLHWYWRLLAHSPCLLVQRSRIRPTLKLLTLWTLWYALGVVEGFEDGSFQPNGTVTRAQMAKMIYVLRTGKSDASAYNDDKTSFTDIGSHWARGYIKYCQSLGIIAGKSNTNFCSERLT